MTGYTPQTHHFLFFFFLYIWEVFRAITRDEKYQFSKDKIKRRNYGSFALLSETLKPSVCVCVVKIVWYTEQKVEVNGVQTDKKEKH